MIRSMLADQPNWPVWMAQGEPTSLWETTTFSTLSPRTVFKLLVRDSKSLVMSTSFLPSNSLSWVKAYSSMGSTRNRTSKFFSLRASRKGDFWTALRDSPVM